MFCFIFLFFTLWFMEYFLTSKDKSWSNMLLSQLYKSIRGLRFDFSVKALKFFTLIIDSNL